MLHHYLIGVGAVVLMSAGWLVVQRAWRKAFPDPGEDPDALAGRLGCHGCAKAADCPRESGREPWEAQEELR